MNSKVQVLISLDALAWMGISWLHAYLSGWRDLRTQFGPPPDPMPAPSSRWFVAGRVGLIQHKASLVVPHDALGRYLRVFPFFRVGHPPLFIPWTAFRQVQRDDGTFEKRVYAAIGAPQITPIRLPLRVLSGTPLEIRRRKEIEGMTITAPSRRVFSTARLLTRSEDPAEVCGGTLRGSKYG